MSTIFKLVSAVSIVALTACSTFHGAGDDLSSAKSSLVGPSKPPVVHHVPRPAPVVTTADQDKAALERADQRANDRAEREKQARHDAYDRTERLKTEQARQEAARAQHDLDIAQKRKADADSRVEHMPKIDPLSRDTIVDRLKHQGYENITLNKDDAKSTADHTVYDGSATKNDQPVNFLVDDTARVTH